MKKKSSERKRSTSKPAIKPSRKAQAKKSIRNDTMSLSPRAVKFEKELKNLSDQELKELLLITMYKMNLLRAQMESLTKVLIKNKLTNYEEIWKDINEHFKDSM